MKHRPFGNINWQSSVLGFGCMRLPCNAGVIDEQAAEEQFRFAIERGVNYFDTAYPYHGGESEKFLGKVLTGDLRQKIRLATKLPCWLVKEAADFDRLFEEQLERLHTRYVDFYLLHGLNSYRWKELKEMGIVDWYRCRMAAGEIGHPAFSFHGSLDQFKQILDDDHPFAMCQIKLNYLDPDDQAGVQGMQYAANKGLAVVVMVPLQGGRLAQPTREVQALCESDPHGWTPAQWGLQWVWNHAGVTCVLSGMNSMQQIRENLAAADQAEPGLLNANDLALINKARMILLERRVVPCTQCGYCIPCPADVDIPWVFKLINDGRMFDILDSSRKAYRQREEQVKAGKREHTGWALECTSCGNCLDLCPQKIDIPEELSKVHQELVGD